MLNFNQVFRKIANMIPMMAVTVVIAVVPAPALADNQGPGGGASERGERPQTRYVSVNEMLRMNDSELQTIRSSFPPAKLSGGAMGGYSIRLIANAIRSKRELTARLIERVENSQTTAERKEIVEGLLRVQEVRANEAFEALMARYRQLYGTDEEGFPGLYRWIVSISISYGTPVDSDVRVQALYDAVIEHHRFNAYLELLRHMRR